MQRARQVTPSAQRWTPSGSTTRLAVLLGSLALTFATACAPDVATTKEPLEPLTNASLWLMMDFDAEIPGSAPLGSLQEVTGRAGDVAVVTSGRGHLLAVPDLSGGAAVGFPPNRRAGQGDLVTIRVSPNSPNDLSPGDSDFQFGADVMYPEGTAGESTVDDGDNLIQRGLFGDKGQYKLQVDRGVAACRLAGTAGEVLVKATVPLENQTWYRLLCQRSGGRVTLFQAELDPESAAAGPSRWDSWSSDESAGAILVAGSTAPLAIGGKLNRQGLNVVHAPDQFTGVMDNVRIAGLP